MPPPYHPFRPFPLPPACPPAAAAPPPPAGRRSARVGLPAVPVNTRWLMLLMVVVTLTGNFGLAPMDLLYFDPEKVLKFQVRPLHPPAPLPLPPATPSGQPGALGRGSLARARQVWRMVTNFFFLGPLGFGFLMHMMILCEPLAPRSPPQPPHACRFRAGSSTARSWRPTATTPRRTSWSCSSCAGQLCWCGSPAAAARARLALTV